MESSENDEDNIEAGDENTIEAAESFIYAVAPKPSSEIEQVGINTTPAFQCLDQV